METKANLFAIIIAQFWQSSRTSRHLALLGLMLLDGLLSCGVLRPSWKTCNRLQHRTASQSLPKDRCFSNHRE